MLSKEEARQWFDAGTSTAGRLQGDGWSDEFERTWAVANAERGPLPISEEVQASSNATEKYLISRDAFRGVAVREFAEADPGALERIGLASEIVASLTLSLSGCDLTQVPNGRYVGDLAVSFCRTHFVVVEHVLQVELIEAKTLLRKQIELLARLREISKGVHSPQVPNVKHLPDRIRKLYGDYSGTAHSSNPDHLILLGRITEGGNLYTPLYPVFDSNACVALQHVCLISLEFCDYLTALYDVYSFCYDISRVALCRVELITDLHTLQSEPE